MLIIERFEGNTGIIEDGGKHFEVSREDLPENAKKYIKYIEEQMKCKITYISVGAEREAYIKL